MRNIQDLRETLFDAIQDLKAGKMDVEKAKVISDLGQVIVNSAKAEADFIKQSGGAGSGFVETPVKKLERPKGPETTQQTLLKKYGG